jgi:hypothetical protein
MFTNQTMSCLDIKCVWNELHSSPPSRTIVNQGYYGLVIEEQDIHKEFWYGNIMESNNVENQGDERIKLDVCKLDWTVSRLRQVLSSH